MLINLYVTGHHCMRRSVESRVLAYAQIMFFVYPCRFLTTNSMHSAMSNINTQGALMITDCLKLRLHSYVQFFGWTQTGCSRYNVFFFGFRNTVYVCNTRYEQWTLSTKSFSKYAIRRKSEKCVDVD